jgi:hypothetical protein
MKNAKKKIVGKFIKKLRTIHKNSKYYFAELELYKLSKTRNNVINVLYIN